MSKHAPGPWKLVPIELYEGGEGIAIIAADGSTVADNQTYYPQELDPKNAPLITHAPDLLEILREVLEWADPYPEGFLQGDNYVESYQRALALVDSL